MARQSSKDLLERVFYAATRVTDLGRNLSDQEIRNRLSAFTGVHYRANCVQFRTDRVLIRAYGRDVGISEGQTK
jgi:hypothetical protein